MAFNVNFGDKYSVFIFILLCTETRIFASKDDVYNVEAGNSKFNDISVIDYETSRQRRQASEEDGVTEVPNTTAAPAPAQTTTPDLDALNRLHDDHHYYTSSMFITTNMNQFWVELKDVTGHSTLSDSHRTAVTAKLPFKFPFYGHLIDNVTIATGGFMYMSPFIHKFLTATQYIAPLMANFDTKSGGSGSTVLYTNVGFLYMSPFLHQWLTATQYIAPLMANFDTTIGNTSEIFYVNMGKKFVVEWRDVHLQDQNGTGAFRFQAILHINGTITFAYRQLPIPIVNISSSSHPVKIGLSDAFYFDTTSFGTRRRTIYEYHRVVLNTTQIQEGTIVMINPQPTCNQYTDCESCVTSNINFECRWCGIINKCSDSVDWHRQQWLNAGCLHLSVVQCETNTSNSTVAPTTIPWSTRVQTPHTTIPWSTHVQTPHTTIPWSTHVQTPHTTEPHIPITSASTRTTERVSPQIHVDPCKIASGKSNCSSIPTAAPKNATPESDDHLTTTTTAFPDVKSWKPSTGSKQLGMGTQIGIIVVVVVIVVALIASLVGWVYYAYSHPTSASGMWLMEHRPSQMKAKMSNMKFWRRNGTAGDKYAVESTA